MSFDIEIIKKSKESIYLYLNKNSDYFIPPLRDRINVLSFSEKIYSFALQFWIHFDNEPIAFAACYFNNPQKDFGFITTISVIKPYQNIGLGVKLINHIVTFAKQNQFKEIRLEVSNENTSAVAFYFKYGFNILERKSNSMILNLNIDNEKKHDILVSICCLTYNHKLYLRDALDGFINQKTNFKFEIIVHDDASTDGTVEIINEYISKYVDIFIPIFQEENQYSKGIKPIFKYVFPRAKGKFIALCEGDDYWTDPYKLQKQVDFLEANPDYILTSGNVIDYIQNENRYVEHKTRKGLFGFEDLVFNSYISTLTAVYRRIEIPSDYATYTAKLHSGDYPLYFMLLQYGKLKVFPDVFGVYRRHDGGVFSSKSFVQSHKLALKSNVEIINYHKSKGWKYKPFYKSMSKSHYYCLENAILEKNKKDILTHLFGLIKLLPYNLDFSKKIIVKAIISLLK
jgi:glycosyltransferase involved in cell wall biosynthesis/GNAT superfamily N-acetyltransferase